MCKRFVIMASFVVNHWPQVARDETTNLMSWQLFLAQAFVHSDRFHSSLGLYLIYCHSPAAQHNSNTI